VRGKNLVWLSLAIAMALSAIMTGPAAAVIPDIYADPAYQATSVGNVVTVDIKIANAIGVYAWQARVVFDGDILLVQTVIEGPWLKSQAPKGTLFIKKVFNNLGAASYMDVACTAIGTFNGAGGSGTLFTITFLAQDVGTSPVNVKNTLLVDPYQNPLPHTETDGVIEVDAGMLLPSRYVELEEKRVSGRHWDISVKGNELTFVGKVKNWADIALWSRVVFSGMKDGEDFTVTTNVLLVESMKSSDFMTYTVYLDPAVDIGTYNLNVYAEFSFYGYKWYTSELGKTKDLSILVEP